MQHVYKNCGRIAFYELKASVVMNSLQFENDTPAITVVTVNVIAPTTT